MSKQRILYGGALERSVNGTTWVPVPEVKSMTLPVITVDYQEVTSLDSPNGFRQYKPGLKDVENITVNCGYTTAAYNQALADQASGALIHFRATLPLEDGQTTADVFTWKAYVTPKVASGAVGEIIGLDIEHKVDGGFTYTEGS